MNWTRMWNRLTGNADREQLELEKELAFHAEMRTRDLTDSGADERSAREQARRELGNLTLAREQVRDARTSRRSWPESDTSAIKPALSRE